MTWLRVFILRLSGMFAKRRRDAQLEEELQSHLEMLVEQNLQRGMTPDEARRAAKLALGGAEQIKEAVRDQRGFPFLESLIADIRFALRMLRKSSGFTAVAVLTLALGIGANTAIFSVTYGILLKPLPFPHPDRIVQIWAGYQRFHRIGIYLSGHDFEGIQQRDRSFAQIATYLENGCCNIYGDAGPQSVQGARVSGNFFSVIGAQPIMGRPILPEDDQPGHDQVAVITYEFWQQFFGADPQIIGKEISIARDSPPGSQPKPYTVIGIMPPLFPFPNLGKILVPDGSWEDEMQRAGIARLKDGDSIDQANAELQSIAAGLRAEYPNTDAGLSLYVTTLRDRITENDSTSLLVLFGAVGFVLLLACLNVGSLLIARCWSRQGEISIRETLGATRPRLLRQLLTESILLAFCGGALAFPTASWGLRLLRVIAPPGTPRLDEIALDWHVFAYTLAISLFSGILFGIAPALLISRVGPVTGLKETRPGSFGTSFSRRPRVLRNGLIIAEISLAFVVVTCATLMARSFLRLSHVNLGFQRNHVLTMWVGFSRDVCPTPVACRNAEDQILDRVSSLPGIQSAAFGVWSPLTSISRFSFQIAGSSESPQGQFQAVTPRYFDTLGIPLLKGRPFGANDTDASPGVAIVNTSMAKMYFAGYPLGRQISMAKDKSGKPIWLEIVGEVGNTRDTNPSRNPEPAFYVPYTQESMLSEHAFIVRTVSDSTALLPAIRKQVWGVDNKAPVPDAKSIDQTIAEKIAEPRFQTSLLGAFGAIALLLSIVGIYGVISYSLAQRTHEIGVRVALGASPGDIIRLVLGEGFLVAAVGIVIGAAAAVGLTRYLGSFLFEIKPLDPVTFIGVALALAATAVLACYIPARRAIRADPMVALRYE